MEKIFDRSTILWIVIVVCATAVPFLNKPYHIDDTFVLHVTSLVLAHPLDPFYGVFDWFGYLQPVWEATTNPPFISYYLAPFAAISDYSEIVLHLGMMLFLFLMAGGTVYLAKRFCGHLILPLLFVMLSPAVMVSGNVMRDVPAAALGTAGLALFIYGTDRDNRKHLLAGSLLAGLAVMTKYSSIIYLPVLMLYPLFRRKYSYALWTLIIPLIVLLWCAHNWLMYGAVHIAYLMVERREEHGFSRMEFIVGAFIITGSIVYLLPSLVWNAFSRRRWVSLINGLVVGIAAYFATHLYLNWETGAQPWYQPWQTDFQYSFWSVLGAMTIYYCLEEGLRRGLPILKNAYDEDAADSLFLFAWLCAPITFSIFLVPFQATRHLITAVPAFVILAFRALGREPIPQPQVQKTLLIAFLVIQGFIGFLVNAADYEYANVYRQYAREAGPKYVSDDHKTWYVGHWGWLFYAERAGMQMRHAGSDLPQPGDIVIRPEFAGLHSHFAEVPEYYENFCEVIEEKVYPGTLPLRSMNFRGAGFYAVTSYNQNIPYRFFQDLPLERFFVYRVTRAVLPEDIREENLPQNQP